MRSRIAVQNRSEWPSASPEAAIEGHVSVASVHWTDVWTLLNFSTRKPFPHVSQFIGVIVMSAPDNAHIGAVHVALTVSDLDGTLELLRKRGVQALSMPVETSAPMAHHRVVYVLDPDSVRVELVQLPYGGSLE